MTFGSIVGLCLTLAFVLALLAVTMRVLKRVASAGDMSRSAIPLEVLQRVTVGPRQSIALVRIADQIVAVSVGEGGVRPIAEVEGDAALMPAASPHEPREFGGALLSRLRSAGLPLVLAACVALPSLLSAQQATGGGQAGAAPRTNTAQPAQVASPVAPAAGGVPARNALDAALGQGMPSLDLALGKSGEGDGLRLSGSVGIVVMLGLLSLLPSLILMMTSFTRILIVLNFVKQALGTQNAPPGQLVAALALILTGFVMAPTMERVNKDAISPWLEGNIEQGAMMKAALVPMRDFMLAQTRDQDLSTFVQLSGDTTVTRREDVSTIVLMSAFVTSELRTAFQLGFVLFLPFIVIDIVVSSVLMSMGMFMLPPAMISLPFKMLLFVLVDGWTLLVQGLVQGFR